MVPSATATPKKNHPESELEKDLKAYLQDGEMRELISESTPLQGLPTAYLEEDT